MINKPITEFTDADMLDLIHVNVDAVVVVDKTTRKYRAMFREGIFKFFIDEEGDYSELIQKLWLHFSDSSEEIAENYKAFSDYYYDLHGLCKVCRSESPDRYDPRYGRYIQYPRVPASGPCDRY